MKNWFDVDKRGLRKLLEAKGKGFALLELLQNAWDADDVTTVNIELDPIPGVAKAHLIITDDSPVGFQHLGHAWTLFAESNRKGRADKRGRYNLGEKLVLSICETATISSTTGTVTFDDSGRKHSPTKKREAGSVFEADMLMTREELDEAVKSLKVTIPPKHIKTYLNGTLLNRVSIPEYVIEATLPTEFADDEGVLRKTRRKTTIELWYVRPGETAHIYELGIPVVETGDKWHVNIMQKVPLNMNRDNVTPAFLQEVRTYVLNHTFQRLHGDEVTEQWVRNALEDERIEPAAVKSVIKEQFGEKAVVMDPSDPEGTKLAMMKGYTVVPSRAFSGDAWSQIRSAGALLPAGQVTPSPKPFSENGRPLKTLERAKWSDGMLRFEDYAQWLAEELIGVNELQIVFTNDSYWVQRNAGAYGPGGPLYVAVGKVALADINAVNEFLLHEYAHERVSDHLSSKFYDEVARLGAKLAIAAATYPDRVLKYSR